MRSINKLYILGLFLFGSFLSNAQIDAGTFLTQTTYVTGAEPQAVATGDFDEDGLVDMAVVNYTNATASIYQNTSTGTGSISFTYRGDISTGTGPIDISVGDVDGDGKVDIVTSNQGANTISVLKNSSSATGTFSFNAKVDLATGTNPHYTSLGDVDGDGKMDIAVANFGSSTVSVYRNIGSTGVVSFAGIVNFTVGSNPRAVEMGDIDGDGKLDLVAANYNSNTVSVLRNLSISGTISMATHASTPTGSRPSSVALGDIDGDGRLDIAVSNNASHSASIFRNSSSSGSISLNAKVDVSTGTSPYTVKVGDIDGDGSPEVLTSNMNSSSVSVLKNNSTSGSVSMGSAVSYSTGVFPRYVTIADFDRDNESDLAVANSSSSSNTVSVLRNASSGAVFSDFSFTEQTGAATIDETNKTIGVEVKSGTDVTSLIATYTASYNASIAVNGTKQTSGTTANDFTSSVVYNITAEDGTNASSWTVSVTVADPALSVTAGDSIGNVNRGETYSGALTVANSTSSAIEVTGASFPSGWSLTTVPLPTSVEANASLNLGISFTSNVLGSADGTGYIYFGTSDSLEVNLKATVVEGNLLGYYKLNGDYSDASGRGYDGVALDVDGNAATISTTSDKDGNNPGAALFVNDGKFIQIRHDSAWNTSSGPLTVNIWVNPTAYPETGRFGDVLTYEDGSTQRLMISPEGELFFHWNQDDNLFPELRTGTTIATGGWTMVSYTIDGSNNLKVFVNAQQVASQDAITLFNGANQTFTIGSNDGHAGTSDGDRYFDGALDEVKIYSKALSEGELFGLYDSRLVAYYPFNFSTSDESGNGLDGTTPDGSGYGDDRFGNTNAAFNMNAGYIELPNVDQFRSQNMTISAWIKADTVGAGPVFYADGGTVILEVSGESLSLSVGQDGELTQVTSSGGIQPGIWQHVVGTYNGSTIDIYLDGENVGSVSKTGSVTYSINPHTIGQSYGSGAVFDGFIDDLYYYNTGLSSSEILEIYNAQKPEEIVDPLLIAQYTFDGGSVTDVSGQGQDASNTGATSSSDRFGNEDNALFFDGNHYLDVPNNLIPTGQNPKLSFSTWVLNSQGGALMGMGAENTTDRALSIHLTDANANIETDGNRLMIDHWGQGINTNVDINDQVWNHIVYVSDGTDEVIYLNGNEVYRSSYSFMIGDNPQVKVGAWDDLNGVVYYLRNGTMDDVRFYNYALSQEEITNIYNLESSNVPADPSNVIAKVAGPNSVKVEWTDNATNENRYQIDYYTDGGATSVGSLFDLPVNTTSAVVTGLTEGTEYLFRVFARNNTDDSQGIEASATPRDLGNTAVTISPEVFTINDEITITFSPSLSYPQNDLVGASKVYMHAGIMDTDGNGPTWVGNWGEDDGVGQMTSNGDGTWSITIIPQNYFSTDIGFVADRIEMVFRNENGSLEGKDGELVNFRFAVFSVENIGELGGKYDVVQDVSLLQLDKNDPVNSSGNTGAFVDMVNAYTMEGLIYVEGLPASGSNTNVMAQGGTGGNTGIIGLRNNGTNPGTLIFWSDIFQIETSTQLNLAQWYHIAGVYDGVSAKLYVNGVLQVETSVSGAVSIGDFVEVGDLTGAVDEIRFWSYARSEQEIKGNILNELTGNESGLVGYWPMNTQDVSSDSRTFTHDVTSNENHLEVFSAGITGDPDLVIEGMLVNKTSFDQQDLLELEYTIRNAGFEAITASTTTKVLLFDGTDVYTIKDDVESGFSVGESRDYSYSVTLPSGIPAGDYNLFVYADFAEDLTNEATTENNYMWIAVTVSDQIADQEGPNLSVNVPSFDQLVQNGGVTANISDLGSGLETVRFYKKRALSDSFAEGSVEDLGDGVFGGVVNSSDIDNLGVTFYFEAYDRVGNMTASSTETIVNTTVTSSTQTVGVSVQGTAVNSYQLLAFPYQSKAASQVLAELGDKGENNDRWRIFAGPSENYNENVTNLQAKIGYWLINNTGVTSLNFDDVEQLESSESSPISINLNAGWNLIGNPYLFTVDWNQVRSHNIDIGNITSDEALDLYVWNSGYSTTSNWSVYRGAFVRASARVTIEIPYSALSGGRLETDRPTVRKRIVENDGWEMIMDFTAFSTDGEWKSGTSGFGEKNDALDKTDPFDMVTPPMFNQFLSGRFTDDELSNSELINRSIKQTAHNNIWNYQIDTHLPSGTAMKVNFVGYPSLESDQRLVLFDNQTGAVVDLANDITYDFTYQSGHTFTLIKGDDQFISENTQVNSVAFNSVYPNPTIDVLNFSLALPEGQSELRIRATITDLQGRTISSQEFDQLQSGLQEFKLDLTNQISQGGLYILDVKVIDQEVVMEQYSRRFLFNEQ